MDNANYKLDICLSGHPRTYKKCYNSIKVN